MNQEIGHQEFYCWLANQIDVNTLDLPVSLDRIRASTDEHFNDIPLSLWDARDHAIRRRARRAGASSWSYSHTVCVLKAVARRAMIEEGVRT